MEVAGLSRETQELLDSVESSIVSGRTTDAQASRLFMALIADRIEELTSAVIQLGHSMGRDSAS